MANKYDSFYLDDLERMIREKAMQNMSKPIIGVRFYDGEKAGFWDRNELAYRNSMTASKNDGIMTLADVLIRELYRLSEERHMDDDVHEKETNA